MLVRYGTTESGKIVKKAFIYTAEEHRIGSKSIDPDARRAIGRLEKAGYRAFIVGGAVRDLLTGRRPKDFDIATNALPKEIRKVFSNSRIIGRRFKLVHLYIHRNGKNRIIEVSTFRSKEIGNSNNIYGPIEEDARRRDFTLNALFYCPFRQIVIDYVNGYNDIKAKQIRTLRPVAVSFQEDPVRMIRGVKYAALTGFRLPFSIANIIRRYRRKLSGCSPDRITEEVYKILKSGCSASIMLEIFRLRLLEVMLPALNDFLKTGCKSVFRSLNLLDKRIEENPGLNIRKGEMLAYLFKDMFVDWYEKIHTEDPLSATHQFLRSSSYPLKPSKQDLNRAAAILLGL